MAAAQYERPYQQIAAELRRQIKAGRWRTGDRLPTVTQLAEEWGRARGTIRLATDLLVKEGLVIKRGGSGIYVAGQAPQRQRPASRPEQQPVVAAVVTSYLGVLAGRRTDRLPTWGLISGEIEPGESAVDAAVREVKEETTLQVRAGHSEIGRRIHPLTDRLLIYLACTPVGRIDIEVGDERELQEVRWLSLAEVDALMPDLYEPVRDHLSRLIT